MMLEQKLHQIIDAYRESGFFGSSPECKRCEFLSAETPEAIETVFQNAAYRAHLSGLRLSMEHKNHLAPDGELRTLIIVDGNPPCR